ncbi:MAG: glycosyltransferase family 4 protein [Microthrixaceae bacterium]
MKLTFVVQRYGQGVVGGAERYVERLATGLAADGHDITVVTSCAVSYADFADVFEPGVEHLDGVTVHRFPTGAPRPNDRFLPLHGRAVDWRQEPLWPWAQDRWSQMMGPDLRGVEPTLEALAASSDATVLVGYHYSHGQRLTRVASAYGPTVVVPTAHPEGAFFVGAVRSMFDHADRVVCLAREEGDLIASVYGCGERVRYVPCPVDPLRVPSSDEVAAATRAVGVTAGRYAVVVGRVDPAKGSDDAVRFTSAFRRSVARDVSLVVVGPGDEHLLGAEGVVATGFVDDATKDALVAGAGVLLQPSYMESFSLALVEGWLLGRPAVVQQRSRVLRGHVERSHGGLTYADYPSFEAAVATVLDHPDVAGTLARNGRAYSLVEFDWGRVAEGWERVVGEARASAQRRLATTGVAGHRSEGREKVSP